VAEEARQLVVLGVGNRLRGDDAVGCLVCDELGKDRIPGSQDSRGQEPIAGILESSSPRPPSSCGSSLVNSVFVLDCGNTPENYIQPVADRNPTRILVVDCCNYGAQPGEFRLFSREEVDRLSYGLLSTHTLPLTLTIEMLSLETRAAIELLGIQPERIDFGEDLSQPVRRALPAVVEFVRNWAWESHPSA
jgi:hydrogenase 3 maturation protease